MAPKTPQQNGVAERRNTSVQETVMTMLNGAKILDIFWREVVYPVFYILNQGQLGVNRDKHTMKYGIKTSNNQTLQRIHK